MNAVLSEIIETLPQTLTEHRKINYEGLAIMINPLADS